MSLHRRTIEILSKDEERSVLQVLWQTMNKLSKDDGTAVCSLLARIAAEEGIL